MCGIAGWVDWQHDLTQQGSVLEEMADRIQCRGPDAGGKWLSRHCAFSHRRLIVVDPGGGGQPMIRWHGASQFVMVYNGELYNTEDLRKELTGYGHRFLGHSDTEVLLTAYVQWGTDCVRRLNGIFAFGIWDTAHRTLFMARDRMGVKPLFYTVKDHALIFASEIKSLLAHPGVEPIVDAEGMAEVFGLGPAHTPGHGIFQGVREVKPGCQILYGPGEFREERYWELQSHPHPHDLKTTARHLRELLEDIVSRQLVADVPVVTLLSGGLDSSVVTALAQKAERERGREPVNTYSIDFVDMERYFKPSDFQTNLDAPWVEIVSRYLGTQHHRVVLDTPDLVEDLLPSMRARDIPGMADVDTSLMVFCRAIKQSATVALSGEAADEIFGGYPWFHLPDALASDTFPWSRTLAERLKVWSPELADRTRLQEYVQDRYHEALAEVPALDGEPPKDARLRQFAYLSMTRFLACLLDRKDRMSMASGLEVRVPYCDHRLVEYVWNIPWSMKRHLDQSKGILRLAVQDLLPQEVVWRRKSPYPSTPNPAYREAMRNLLVAVLNDPNAPLHPWINESFVRSLTDPTREIANIPWYGQLMGTAALFAFLVQLNAWLTEYRVRIV